MSLLDKLLEKKDVEAYAGNRIEHLKRLKAEVPEKESPENRELVIKRFEGRIDELQKIKELAHNNGFRDKSKEHWKIEKEQ